MTISGLLGWVPKWIWAAIALVIAAFLVWAYIQGLVCDRNNAVRQLERARLEAAALESALEWWREQAARQQQALEVREAALQRASARYSQQLEALDQLEQTDDETADWTGVAVPGAVRDWLRQLPGKVDRTDRDDPGSTGVSADATARAEALD
jgi:hypothetical protein